MEDVSAQLDAETLPSGHYMLVRDIKKALDGEGFSYFLPEGGLPLSVPGMKSQDVSDYLTLYNRWKRFGLPHGKGWLHELPWVIDLLAFLDDVYSDIQSWHMHQAYSGIGKKAATPDDFGLED